MTYTLAREQGSWSRGGAIMAVVALAEIALAWTLAMHPTRPGAVAVAVGTVVAIGSVIAIGGCRMPMLAKALLLAAGCGSLLTWTATQDSLGLRRIEARTGAALSDAAAHAGDRVHVQIASATGLSGGDRAAAARLEESLDGRLAGADVSVTTTFANAGRGEQHYYQLRWSLVRGDDRLWCGDYTEPARADAGFAMLLDRVTDAAKRSHGGPLACA